MGAAGAGLALSALGTGASLLSQNKQRKEVKKANEAQRAKDAFINLISVASGAGPQAGQPISAAPVVDYGGAIGNIGNSISSYAATQEAQKAQNFLSNLKAQQLEEAKRSNIATETLAQSGQTIDAKYKDLMGQAYLSRAKSAETAANAAANKAPTGSVPTYNQAVDILQGKGNDTLNLINILRAQNGQPPLDMGGPGQLPDSAKEFLYQHHPSLRPQADKGDVLGLGF